MGSEKNKVSVLVYKHRHGEDVTVYRTHELALSAAVDIIRDNLHEVEPLARAKIAAMIADQGNPVTDEDIIEAWHDATGATSDCERIEISDDVMVQEGEATAGTALKPMCPKCSTTALDDLEVRETYSAYHPVKEVVDGKLFVANALTVTCPSEQFDEGKGDYEACCKSCTHTGTPESFGLGDPSEWEWV